MARKCVSVAGFGCRLIAVEIVLGSLRIRSTLVWFDVHRICYIGAVSCQPDLIVCWERNNVHVKVDR